MAVALTEAARSSGLLGPEDELVVNSRSSTPEARTPARSTSVTVQLATTRFLVERDLAPRSRVAYRETLNALAAALGPTTPVTAVAGRTLVSFLGRWRDAAPRTYNRHRGTLSSFFDYCARQGWVTDNPVKATEARREPADETRAMSRAELERLFTRRDVPIREKVLWQVLYETAARTSEILGLDVDDVDLANRRAKVVRKGGALEYVHFQTAGTRGLAVLMRGRRSGPVFLAHRRPPPGRSPAAGDVDPLSGRTRLSYRRAAHLFSDATGGATLHQLRHSALTHLAEAGVSQPMLMAKSGHLSLRSLQRYVRPGSEAVAAMTQANDPARRR